MDHDGKQTERQIPVEVGNSFKNYSTHDKKITHYYKYSMNICTPLHRNIIFKFDRIS